MHHPSQTLKHRWLGFLLWQTLSTTLVYFLLTPIANPPSSLLPTIHSLLTFSLFHLSTLIFSLSIFLLSSPHPHVPHASLYELAHGMLRGLLRMVLGGFQGRWLEVGERRRVTRSGEFGMFVAAVAVSGFIGALAVCGDLKDGDLWKVLGVGVRGLFVGLMFGGYYVYCRRWVLLFPIVQRPLFFSFKIGISSSLNQSLKLSIPAFLSSLLLIIFLPNYMKANTTLGQFIIDQFTFCIGMTLVIFNWELSHNLLQVVHTRRCVFAPSQGSADAETNPSETLLESLEQSSSRSLLQYLAYLDLCLVSESNTEPWRRAAFFEETGETYRRIVSLCLRPLEQLVSRLGQVFEGFSEDKSGLLYLQITSSTNSNTELKLQEAFDDFQVCAWCARTVAALTAHSHSEDRFGVAQLSGCNAGGLSMLLSCLLAVEVCLGKKTNPQPVQNIGRGSIRWASLNRGSSSRQDGNGVAFSKKKNGILHSKAYAMADVLRASIYEIASVFESDMFSNAKASVLEKNWIADSKPLYGTREILVQKLGLFLEFRA